MTKAKPSLPWAIAGALRRFPRAYWLARRGFTAVNRLLPSRTLEGIPGPVHRNDLMLDVSLAWSRRQYLTAGLEAVGFMREARQATGGRLETSDVLDFGCGYGRVVRHLVKDARSVTACDLDHEGVAFCSRSFGAVPLLAFKDINKIALSLYDVVWLGSVITHHPPEVCSALLQTLARHLKPNGVLVATSADGFRLDQYLNGTGFAWLRPDANRLHDDLDRVGAAYVQYPQNTVDSYGLGFQTDQWLDGTVADTALRPLWHRSRVWLSQTVHAWHSPGA